MDKLDLGWMRVLVEAVRCGTLAGAAAALGLTQPAVSYQIRRLEAQVGFSVLRRRHQGVELTPAGRRLFEIVERSVRDLDALMREYMAAARRPSVRLRTDYAFSSYWLIPRMHAFRQRFPEIDIQIVATQRFQPGQMEDSDVAVIFADMPDYDQEATMLVAEEIVPVCSPAFLAQLGAPGAGRLAQARLIHLDADAASPWFDWQNYFETFGLARTDAHPGGDLRFNTYSLVIQAALEHQGVAIGWRGLVDSYLRSQLLVTAGPPLQAPNRGYFLLAPLTRNANSNHFMAWLREEAVKAA